MILYEDFEPVLRPVIIQGIEEAVDWFDNKEAPYLRSVFDEAGFKGKAENSDIFYTPPESLFDNITYPISDTIKLEKIKKETGTAFKNFLSQKNLTQLSLSQLLFLLEKFGGTIPCKENNDIAVFDSYKIKAAKAVISQNRKKLNHDNTNLLIDIDVSGIQPFIYNIVSAGALKNLRARSFFIELLCSHTLSEISDSFHLHPVNVLMNGGGHIVVLSGKPFDYKEILERLDKDINKWLLNEFDGAVHVLFSAVKVSDDELSGDMSDILNRLAYESFKNKNRRFNSLIKNDEFNFADKKEPGILRCPVCQKDFSTNKTEPDYESDDENEKCQICEKLIRIGNIVPKIRYIYKTDNDSDTHTVKVNNSYYLLSENKISRLECIWRVYEKTENFFDDLKECSDIMLAKQHIARLNMMPPGLIKDIDEEIIKLKNKINSSDDKKEKKPLEEELNSLPKEDDDPVWLEHLAEASKGAGYIGALQMDSDNMGKILQKGFKNNALIEKIVSFSRFTNYFFKLYLNFLCRNENMQKVHIIYAGGDDLFAIGAWSDIADMSIEAGDAFGRYTCENIDMGLSGGFTIHKAKFPVSQMALASKAALDESKNNFEPCCQCIENWGECPLYKNGNCQRKDSLTPFYSEQMAHYKKETDKSDKSFIKKYSKEPSRIKMSFKRKKHVKKVIYKNEIKEYIKEPVKAFSDKEFKKLHTGFWNNVLHMLTTWHKQGLIYMPRIAWLLQKHRQHMKGILENGQKAYEACDQYLHIMGPEMLSALHISIEWTILAMRKGGKNNDS
jgi:CRISPR-associated protein Cas10/Csm1 subtype III-A